MKKTLKWTLAILGSILLFLSGLSLYIGYLFGDLVDAQHTTKELVDNYKQRTAEIWAVKNYISTVVPHGNRVRIEFDNDGRSFDLSSSSLGNNWGLMPNSSKADSLLRSLGWNTDILIQLKQKLDDANCISVCSGEPCTIGWQRSGMGMYFYNLFDKPLAASQYSDYNDSCTYILYTSQVVLEYGGGAIGSQCFTK